MGSASKLENYVGNLLHDKYPWFTIKENVRPQWLTDQEGARLELDYYLPEVEFAIEVQGMQHAQRVEHFHDSEDDFQVRLRRDRFKKEACKEHGVRLFEIWSESDVDRLVELIDRAIVPQQAGFVKDKGRMAALQPLEPEEEQLLKSAGMVVKNGQADYVLIRRNGKRLKAEPLSTPGGMMAQTAM